MSPKNEYKLIFIIICKSIDLSIYFDTFCTSLIGAASVQQNFCQKITEAVHQISRPTPNAEPS